MKQLICKTEPHCLCAGGPTAWDECCCSLSVRTEAGTCSGCGAELVLIDMDTGEDVADAVTA